MKFPEILEILRNYFDDKIDFPTIFNVFGKINLSDLDKAMDIIDNLPTLYSRSYYLILQKIYNNIQK